MCFFFSVPLFQCFLTARPSKHSGFPIVINGNGLPTVLGIPVSSGFPRNVVFGFLRCSKIPVVVTQVYVEGVSLERQCRTNLTQTMRDLYRLGVIMPSRVIIRPPPRPSPYE